MVNIDQVVSTAVQDDFRSDPGWALKAKAPLSPRHHRQQPELTQGSIECVVDLTCRCRHIGAQETAAIARQRVLGRLPVAYTHEALIKKSLFQVRCIELLRPKHVEGIPSQGHH